MNWLFHLLLSLCCSLSSVSSTSWLLLLCLVSLHFNFIHTFQHERSSWKRPQNTFKRWDSEKKSFELRCRVFLFVRFQHMQKTTFLHLASEHNIRLTCFQAGSKGTGTQYSRTNQTVHIGTKNVHNFFMNHYIQYLLAILFYSFILFNVIYMLKHVNNKAVTLQQEECGFNSSASGLVHWACGISACVSMCFLQLLNLQQIISEKRELAKTDW